MRRIRPRRPVALVPPLVLALFCAVAPAPATSARADGPAPRKKDSNARFQPKTAKLTATVSPAEARPGDVVEFKVHAKLDATYHIYAYSAKPGEPGVQPGFTMFDLFDTAGLVTQGDWKASGELIKHKDPNFPEAPFVEYYEGEASWTMRLKVPDDARPGEKPLKIQSAYMICNDTSCSIYGRWTLPSATLKVVAGDAPGQPTANAAKEKETAGAAPAEAAAPAPKRKDRPARLKPDSASLTATVAPAKARPGDLVDFKIHARLDPTYHIYKYSDKPGEPGVQPGYTMFDLFDTAGLVPQGDWAPAGKLVKEKDPNFPEVPFVEYYENEASWTMRLKVPEDAPPGERPLKVQATYMICNDVYCSVYGGWTLPAATLTVSAGAAGQTSTSSAAGPEKPGAAPVEKSAAKAEPAPSSRSSAAPAATATAEKPAETSPSSSSSSSPSTSAAPPVLSEIAEEAEKGLIPFLIASAIGGLFALVMPCVWPMVPITVNFFVKQGQGKHGRGRATGLAFIYSLSIIGIFTAVGVFFAFFFSASSLQKLANNPWLNLGVAALFLAFGLSLLGLFEIRLPSFLLNASSQGESRGGTIGVIFMALTLTITSFTCTFPVVGGLLVMASQGDFFYPVVGLATFAAVIALPFFLLALSPGLIHKMPRSGDWMNAVKVVGGLVEIGASLKFLNTMELAFVTPEEAWFNAPVVLTCWVALSLVCGLYLLGVFQTDHDHDAVKVGPGRLVFGAVFLGLALYLLPALFGRAPRGQVWDRLIVGLLPPDSSSFSAPETVVSGNGGAAAPSEVKATSTDPAQAEREQTSFHGVAWGMSYEQALERAKAENRPVLIDFTGVNCANCRQMERGVFPRREIVALLEKFVTVQLYTDFVPIGSITRDQRQERAELNQTRLLDLANIAANPYYVVLSPSGAVIDRLNGYKEAPAFAAFLTQALEKAGTPSSNGPAQTAFAAPSR